jgi:hypothetical protein
LATIDTTVAAARSEALKRAERVITNSGAMCGGPSFLDSYEIVGEPIYTQTDNQMRVEIHAHVLCRMP